jgi:hypothetical protein
MTKIASSYSPDFLEIDRPKPLSDSTIESLIQDVLLGKLDKNITDEIYDQFKIEMQEWLFKSKINKFKGFEIFERIDIINGCTQFIDNLYIGNNIQVLHEDYKYHERLGICKFSKPSNLIPNIPLIIAMPFPSIGTVHPLMQDILDECFIKNIPVHIDGAWVSCCRDINFDVSHPSIESIGISLSKGLGLGWNRIGLRWSKKSTKDSITIMNDFRMNNRALSMIGLHFLRNLPTDYLWNKYEDIYYQICKDFNLTPTKSIYLALRDNNPVGISPLIRYVAEQ